MREKGRKRKDKKILIRVSRDEKALAEKTSKAEGDNTSEFFRKLLKEHVEREDMKETIETAVEKGTIKAFFKFTKNVVKGGSYNLKKKRRRK